MRQRTSIRSITGFVLAPPAWARLARLSTCALAASCSAAPPGETAEPGPYGLLGADSDSGSLLLDTSEVYHSGGGTTDDDVSVTRAHRDTNDDISAAPAASSTERKRNDDSGRARRLVCRAQ